MPDLEFWSADGRYGARFTDESLSSILQVCREAGDRETGGILVGYYTAKLDMAVVVSATGPPSDSRSGKTWFKRGVKGLREHLLREWAEHGHYYLGEWHSHPYASPNPSPTDIHDMAGIAASEHYQCDAPVLLIVGGDVGAAWEQGVYVFPTNMPCVELSPRPGM